MHQREGSLLRGRVSRGLHLQGGGPALHPPRRVHRLRRVRAGVPGHGDLPGRGRTAAVEVVHREESGRVPGRQTAGEAVSGKGREVGARAPYSRVTLLSYKPCQKLVQRLVDRVGSLERRHSHSARTASLEADWCTLGLTPGGQNGNPGSQVPRNGAVSKTGIPARYLGSNPTLSVGVTRFSTAFPQAVWSQ